MIKVVFFDFGGVYCTRKRKEHTWKVLWQLVQKRIGKRYDYSIFSNLQGRLDAGELTLRQYYSRLMKRVGRKYTKKELDRFSKPFVSKPIFNMRVRKLVAQLRKNGYKVPLITNAINEVVRVNRKRGYYDIFHPLFISCEVRMSKREKGIYRLACKKLKVKPNESVMIDDNPDFLKPAREIGMKTMLYKSPEQLRMKLKELGVNL
ncbi:MAG TPA: HAD family phosphatase [archaeon]|nr:HAD family phosphatase [archaeon]